MNIGELRKNDRGIYVGKIDTLAVAMTIALNRVRSDNERAPVYEIYAMNKSRAWVKVGALWEKSTRETQELFLQGNIDDPSLDRRLNIACFMREDGSYAIAWSRPRRTQRDLPGGDNQGADDRQDEAQEPAFPFAGDAGNEAPRTRGRRRGNDLGESTSDADF